jgi:hypothetical protein
MTTSSHKPEYIAAGRRSYMRPIAAGRRSHMPAIVAAGRRSYKVVVLCACLAAPGAFAAWETVPEITLFAESDDNVLLNAAEKQSASRLALEAMITLSNFNERGNVYVRPTLVTDAYSGADAKDFESDDLFFDAGGEYAWRTVDVGFRSRFSEQSILNSEFIGVAPGDPDTGEDFIDPDTGRLEFFSEERRLLDLRGNIDFRISERNEFRLEANRLDVAYSGAQSTFRSDFDNNSVALSIIRRADDRNTISARMIVSEYNADLNDNSTDSVGLEGTFTRPLAPTWTMRLSAGVQRNEFSFLQGLTPVDNADTNSIFSLNFRKRAERTSWNFDLAHRVQPNGNGFLAIRDSLAVSADHAFSERLTGRVGVRYMQTETLGGTRIQDERDYTRAEARLEWALKETLFMFFGYDRIDQEFVNEAEGVSNAFLFGITYRGRSRQEQVPRPRR